MGCICLKEACHNTCDTPSSPKGNIRERTIPWVRGCAKYVCPQGLCSTLMYRKDETVFFYSIETAFKPFMVRQHAGMTHHETWTAYEKNYIDT